MLRVDNAPELVRGPFESYTKANGITYEKIVPEASPQNGVAERANWTVASMTRAMLMDGDMRDFFWPLAAQAAVHIKNRVPHKALPKDTTPFELWFGRKADLSHIRPFGCHVTVRKQNTEALGKFEARGEPGRFVGYPSDASGYLIWFPNGRAVRVRRDVIFHNMPETPDLPTQSPLWEEVPMPLEYRFQDENPITFVPKGQQTVRRTSPTQPHNEVTIWPNTSSESTSVNQNPEPVSQTETREHDSTTCKH